MLHLHRYGFPPNQQRRNGTLISKRYVTTGPHHTLTIVGSSHFMIQRTYLFIFLSSATAVNLITDNNPKFMPGLTTTVNFSALQGPPAFRNRRFL